MPSPDRETQTHASEETATATPSQDGQAAVGSGQVQLKRRLQRLALSGQRAALAPPGPFAAIQAAGGSVQAAAEMGTAGAGSSLPHLDAIQASFGAHDVTGVQAHLGAGARDAATSVGARAFATGNDVVFGGAPDLHTAAHEAAHVVQQRGGVDLPGGVGRAGDRYERHADAVADRVVAGGSAEGLLDTMAPAGASPGHAGGSVQRLELDDYGDAELFQYTADVLATLENLSTESRTPEEVAAAAEDLADRYFFVEEQLRDDPGDRAQLVAELEALHREYQELMGVEDAPEPEGGGAVPADPAADQAAMWAEVQAIDALDGVSHSNSMHLSGGGYAHGFYVRPQIGAMFDDVLPQAYWVSCVGDLWQLYAMVDHALRGEFHMVIGDAGAGSAYASEGIEGLVQGADLGESRAVQALQEARDGMSGLEDSEGRLNVPLSLEDLQYLRRALESFVMFREVLAQDLEPFYAEHGATMVGLQDPELSSDLPGRGTIWMTMPELQAQVNETVAEIHETLPATAREQLGIAQQAYIDIQEENTSFADFLGSFFGTTTMPDEFFESAYRAIRIFSRDIDYGDQDVPLDEFDSIMRRAGACVRMANSTIQAVIAYGEYREALGRVGACIIEWGMLITTSLGVAWLSAGASALASMTLAGGGSVVRDVGTHVLTEGDFEGLDGGAVLGRGMLSAFTAGVGTAAGRAISQRVSPHVLSHLERSPHWATWAQRLGGETRLRELITNEVAGLSGDVVAEAVGAVATTLTDDEATFDDLLEAAATNLVINVVGRRVTQHVEEHRAGR